MGPSPFFDQALFPSKEEVRVPCRRGVALRSLGLYEEAGAAYLAALDLNTRQVDAHYNRGISTGIPSEWRRPPGIPSHRYRLGCAALVESAGSTANTRQQTTKGRIEMAVTVHVPTPLRKLTDNQSELQIEAGTVGELVDNLESAHPGMKEKLLDESGEIRRYVNIFVNDEDIRFLDGKGSELKDADSVSIVPAIAGGGAILGGSQDSV